MLQSQRGINNAIFNQVVSPEAQTEHLISPDDQMFCLGFGMARGLLIHLWTGNITSSTGFGMTCPQICIDGMARSKIQIIFKSLLTTHSRSTLACTQAPSHWF